MINTGNLPGSRAAPARAPGTLLVAAIDVEWSKNYRIRGGNVPFCYSVVWLALSGEDVRPGSVGVWYLSAYVHGTGSAATWPSWRPPPAHPSLASPRLSWPGGGEASSFPAARGSSTPAMTPG